MPLFGTYLKHFRAEKDLSLRRIAESVGVDPSIMSRLERGEIAAPSDEVLSQLPTILGRPVEEVYLAAGRITPELATALEQGVPLTIKQAAHTLKMLEDQVKGALSPLNGVPLAEVSSSNDMEIALRITEAMTCVAEIAQGMDLGQISRTQFEHFAETLRHLKLSLLPAPNEVETPEP